MAFGPWRWSDRVARPNMLVDQPQRDAIDSHGHGGMDIENLMGWGPERAKVFRCRMVTLIDSVVSCTAKLKVGCLLALRAVQGGFL